MEIDLRAVLLALAPVALVALYLYARWLRLLRVQGGRLPVAHFRLPDLMVTAGLGFFLGTSALKAFLDGTAEQPQNLDFRLLGLAAIVELVALGGLWAFLRFRQVPLREIIGWHRLPLLQVVGYAVLFLVVAAPLVMVASATAHAYLPGEEEQGIVNYVREQARAGHQREMFLIFLSAGLLAPLVEESFFRGYFYGTLKRYCGPVLAALLTAALFALLHANVAALAPLFLLALCFTIAYEWTGSLLVPFTMHLLFNSTNLLAMLWQVKHQAP